MDEVETGGKRNVLQKYTKNSINRVSKQWESLKGNGSKKNTYTELGKDRWNFLHTY